MTNEALATSTDAEAVAALLAVLRAEAAVAGGATVRDRLAAEARPRPSGANGAAWFFSDAALDAAGLFGGTTAQPTPAATAKTARRTLAATAEPTGRVRRRWFVVVAAALAVLALAGLTVWIGDDGGQPTQDPVTELVSELIGPGRQVGYVGPQAAALVPAGRTPVPVTSAATLEQGPRFVVAVADPDAPSGLLATLASRATEVLTVERPLGTVRVFDRDRNPGIVVGSGPAPAPPPPMASDPAPAPPGEVASQPPPDPAPPPAAAARSVVVQPGDHFWKLAEDVAEASLGRPSTDGEVTGVWLDLLERNQEILIEPGNPNLLLAGQTVLLPPA